MFMPTCRAASKFFVAALAFSCPLEIADAQCASAPCDVVSWWPADGDATDIAGNSDGTFSGGATLADGQVGAAFSFDGVDDFVTASGVDFARGDYSVEVWFNTGQLIEFGAGLVTSFTEEGLSGVYLEVRPDGSLRYLHRFPLGNTGGTNIYVPGPFNDAEFHFAVATKEGDVMKLYVDGDLEGMTTDAATHDAVFNINIGHNAVFDGDAESRRPFAGLIDEVTLYRRALHHSEVQAIYDAGRAGKCPRLCDTFVSYCHCVAGLCGNADPSSGCVNSTGAGALLEAGGTASVTSDELTLAASNVPPNQFGILFMGAGQTQVPFGDGLLCVSSGNATTCRFDVQNSGPNGTMTEGPGIVAYSLTQELACHIDPGETWNFQAWYRDPLGPCGGFFNLSHAVAVTFSP